MNEEFIRSGTVSLWTREGGGSGFSKPGRCCEGHIIIQKILYNGGMRKYGTGKEFIDRILGNTWFEELAGLYF